MILHAAPFIPIRNQEEEIPVGSLERKIGETSKSYKVTDTIMTLLRSDSDRQRWAVKNQAL